MKRSQFHSRGHLTDAERRAGLLGNRRRVLLLHALLSRHAAMLPRRHAGYATNSGTLTPA